MSARPAPALRARRARVWASGALVALTLAGCGGIQERSTAANPTTTTSTSPPPPASGEQCAALAGSDLDEFADLTLSEAVAKMPGATAYSAYLEANPDRTKQFDKAQTVTVFIPADVAFTTLDADTQAKLADPEWVLALLEYSVVPLSVLPDDLQSGESAELPTVRSGDAKLAAVVIDGQVKLNGAAGLLCSSISFAGGLIYLTDRVLLPPE